jgi:hypothetical protein
VGQGRALGQAEEDEQRSLDERHDDDLGERGRAQRKRHREAAERSSTSRFRYEHDALAVPAIDQCARRKVEEHERQRLGEADESRLRRRAGPREHE